jgi:hypothetical protein
VLLLIVAAGLLGLDAARSARVMLSQIKLARNSLDNGVESVVVGDTNGAPAQLQQAIGEATKVVDASNRVVFDTRNVYGSARRPNVVTL